MLIGSTRWLQITTADAVNFDTAEDHWKLPDQKSKPFGPFYSPKGKADFLQKLNQDIRRLPLARIREGNEYQSRFRLHLSPEVTPRNLINRNGIRLLTQEFVAAIQQSVRDPINVWTVNVGLRELLGSVAAIQQSARDPNNDWTVNVGQP